MDNKEKLLNELKNKGIELSDDMLDKVSGGYWDLTPEELGLTEEELNEEIHCNGCTCDCTVRFILECGCKNGSPDYLRGLSDLLGKHR